MPSQLCSSSLLSFGLLYSSNMATASVAKLPSGSSKPHRVLDCRFMIFSLRAIGAGPPRAIGSGPQPRCVGDDDHGEGGFAGSVIRCPCPPAKKTAPRKAGAWHGASSSLPKSSSHSFLPSAAFITQRNRSRTPTRCKLGPHEWHC